MNGATVWLYALLLLVVVVVAHLLGALAEGRVWLALLLAVAMSGVLWLAYWVLGRSARRKGGA